MSQIYVFKSDCQRIMFSNLVLYLLNVDSTETIPAAILNSICNKKKKQSRTFSLHCFTSGGDISISVTIDPLFCQLVSLPLSPIWEGTLPVCVTYSLVSVLATMAYFGYYWLKVFNKLMESEKST